VHLVYVWFFSTLDEFRPVDTIISVTDIGKAINPLMVEGQAYGGMLQSLSIGLMEGYIYNKDGVTLNSNFTDYKIPTASEMPANKAIEVMLTGVPHREGPYGAKGIGEGPVIAYPPAVSNAIYNAIGVRMKDDIYASRLQSLASCCKFIGYFLKSSPAWNCVGLTNILTTVISFSL
jgi:xanthine dehydrogenase molybdopterin-binding subunit B